MQSGKNVSAAIFRKTDVYKRQTRDGINDKILELGAKPGSSVTKKTDYLICGEKADVYKRQQIVFYKLPLPAFLDYKGRILPSVCSALPPDKYLHRKRPTSFPLIH